jgi:protein farnesyltransferase/geranylgeranyltransferase type-1 subunit alpha
MYVPFDHHLSALFSTDSEAMDYFRAVARVNEKSKRVLELTAHIIDMNPAHYTIW